MVSAHSNDDSTSRSPARRTTRWILLDADRWLLTSALLAALFAAFVTFGAVDPVPLRRAVVSTDPIETLFQALLTAIVTGVTLVVTINQLVLSQELGSVGDQRERMQGAMAFRRDVEAALDIPVSPADPAGFLQALLDSAAEQGDRLAAAVDAGVDASATDRLRRFGEGLQERATVASRQLDGAEFGTFEVVAAALEFDYSEELHRARELRHAIESAEADGQAPLDRLVETLELFAPTREHVKTLYFQWELINLSRAVLYAAVPALAVTASMILYVDDPATITGSTLAVDNLVWVVSGSAIIALLPFMLLLSYILRITTIAKRTLAIGPFVLQTREPSRAAGRRG